MRWSRMFIPTLKDSPSDAENISHKLMLKGGYIRQLFAGAYSFLPLAQRSLLKITSIVREEMNRIGAQEILMPALNPIEIWDKTGRNDVMGDEMFRLKDRKERLLCLAPTHEEVIATIAAGEIRSYRELPQVWYQIQTKFRDEPRPRSGILRVREFLMKDSYTLAATEEQLDISYNEHSKAYRRILARCGLDFIVVGASTGTMGGTVSQEFMLPSDAGEDEVVFCPNCKYAANVDVAESILPEYSWQPMEREEVHTPAQKSIEEVSEFLDIPPEQLVKSLVMVVDEKEFVMALVRGDRKLCEEKLKLYLGASNIRPAQNEEIEEALGVPAGFLGPYKIKKKIKIIADEGIEKDMPFATGANRVDYHIKGLRLSEIDGIEFANIREAETGDICIRCGKRLKRIPTIEIGHIFKLGTKYSKALGANFLDENGESRPIIMGSYGIGIGRILAAAMELFADEAGTALPISIAPFEVIITPLNITNPDIVETAEKIYKELLEKNVDVIIDDRDIRAGSKFKDAELIGIPLRITIGERSLASGKVEIFIRRDKKKIDVPKGKATDELLKLREEMFEELTP